MGLDEFIAYDEQGYVDLAVELAKDLNKLSALRAGMRKRLQKSKLLNAQLFMEEFEAEMLKLV